MAKIKIKSGEGYIDFAPSQQEFDDFKESTEKELASLTFSDVSLNETRIKYLLKNVGTTLVDTTKQFVEKTKASTMRMRGIASGNGVIVAVGLEGACQYSNNGGNTWTLATSFTAGAVTAIAYGRNYFICVDSLGKVFRSLNGQEWDEIEFINSKTINSIIYAGGRFVIVGVEGLIAISFNGLKFEIIDTGVSYGFTQITFGEGMYVACSADSHIMMSKNSIEWVDVSIAGSTDLYYSAGYGNGKFILGANAGIMRYSTDGITWQTATNNSTSTISYIRAITFIENVYYAVMYLSNGGGEIWVSQDGITWTVLQTITGTSRLWACCNYTDSKVIATGESGRVFVLDLGITWSYVYPTLTVNKEFWRKNESILSDGSYVYGLPRIIPSVPFLLGNSTGTAGTWTASTNEISEYSNGTVILFQIGIAGASTTTLNINNLGAKTVYRYGSTKLTTHYPVNSIIQLVYNANLNSGCFMLLNDAITTYSTITQAEIDAGTSTSNRLVTPKLLVDNFVKTGDGRLSDTRTPTALTVNGAIGGIMFKTSITGLTVDNAPYTILRTTETIYNGLATNIKNALMLALIEE